MKALIFLILLIPGFAVAQSPADSVRHAFLPGAGYSSDDGFGIGLMYQYAHYQPEVLPYRHLFRVQGNASTKGNFVFRSDYENRAQSGHRYFLYLAAEKIESAVFFGLGNDSRFDRENWDDEFFDYTRWYGAFSAERGIPLRLENGRIRAEWVNGFQISYFETADTENRRIGELQPRGIEGGWFTRLSSGLKLDYRDSHFRPETGYRFELMTGFSPGFANNNAATGYVNTFYSVYRPFTLIFDVVAAGRIGYEQLIGSAPFYMMPALGGKDDLRGFAYERFRDNGKLYYNAELRTWLFSLPFWEIDLGGQLFLDGGRVFDHPFGGHIFQDHHFSAGFGGVMSLFNPDFIIRGDIGFSDEFWRINIGIGYLF